jgi:hypothetical protein
MPNRDERPEREERAVRDAGDTTGIPRTTTTGDPARDVRSDDRKGTTADRWREGGDALESHREDLDQLYDDGPERRVPERKGRDTPSGR